MRRQGYQLTRWADDWVVTCRTRAEAEHALARAVKILEQLGVTLNQAKTPSSSFCLRAGERSCVDQNIRLQMQLRSGI
jgi:hypothetical protein